MTKYYPFQMDHGSTDPSTWDLPEGAITRIGRGGIQDTALSPDGKLLAIATYIGLWWYDVEKRELITLWEKGRTVSSVAFSSCGEWIAISWGRLIRICEVATGECIIELPREDRISPTEIVFSPNREYLAVGGYSRYSNPEKNLYCCTEVWKLRKYEKEIGTTDLPIRVGLYVGTNPLAFSPDNRLLAFASPDGEPEPYNKNGYPVINGKWVLASNKVVLFELESGKHLTTLSGMEDIGSICFSPCGKQIAACDYNGQTRVWEVPADTSADDSHKWKLQNTYQKPNEKGLQSISYTAESDLFASFYHFKDDTFSVKDLENSDTFYRHMNETGFYNTDFSSEVHLAFESEHDFCYWKLGENRPVNLEHSSGVWPRNLLFSLDGKTLYAKNYSGILSFDISSPNLPAQVFRPGKRMPDSDSFGEQYTSITISSGGKCFVTSGDENSVRLWELGSNTPIVSFPIESEVSDAIFSPIMNLLACHDEDNRIYVWDITTNEIYDTFTVESPEYLQYIAFSPDGKYIVCHRSRIYDVSERKLLDRYSYDDGINFHAFSSESTQIWCEWSNCSIDLWDFLKDEEVMSIPKPGWWDNKHIESLAVSSCGKYMACSPDTWDCSGNLCVWDITKGKEPIAKFTTPDSPKCLTFSHDNTILAGCYGDGTMLLWDMKPYL